MSKTSHYTTVKQENPGKCPILDEGEDKQVHKVIAGICDQQMKDHISTNCACIVTLNFPQFLRDLKDNWLDKNWEVTTCIQLLHIVQAFNQLFQDYMVAMLVQNSLLMGTTSHLSNAKLCHQLEAGLKLHLSQKVKSNTIIAALNADDFTDWNAEVKRVDEALCAETVHFEEITTCNHERARCEQHNQTNHGLTCKNSNNNNTTIPNAAPFAQLPKLTSNEHTLLMDNHRCLKCHHVFAYHILKDCPNDWPNAATYRPVTIADITAAGKAGRVRKGTAAAVMSTDAGPSSAVTAIVTSHPVAYVASNMQSIINNDRDYSDSNDSSKVSNDHPPLCAAVISEMEILVSTAQQIEMKMGPVPFFEPHLWWCCSTGTSDFVPQTFNGLIDPGSHAVLIHEDLVKSLFLCHCTLHKPKIIELAMDTHPTEKEIKRHIYQSYGNAKISSG